MVQKYKLLPHGYKYMITFINQQKRSTHTIQGQSLFVNFYNFKRSRVYVVWEPTFPVQKCVMPWSLRQKHFCKPKNPLLLGFNWNGILVYFEYITLFSSCIYQKRFQQLTILLVLRWTDEFTKRLRQKLCHATDRYLHRVLISRKLQFGAFEMSPFVMILHVRHKSELWFIIFLPDVYWQRYSTFYQDENLHTTSYNDIKIVSSRLTYTCIRTRKSKPKKWHYFNF